MKKINQKGFTLVELLAVISILSIVTTITLYISASTIDNAKDKTHQITINNIEKEASNYLEENKQNILFINQNNIEYQCVSIKNLIDAGYFNTDILKSEISKNNLVNEENYVYIERDKITKIIKKNVLIKDSSNEYSNFCENIKENILKNIIIDVIPTEWSKDKKVTVTYKIRNYNNINDYEYNLSYEKEDGEATGYTVSEPEREISVYSNGTVIAKINTKAGKTLLTTTKVITKIDTIVPTIKSTNVTYSSLGGKISFTGIDNESGIVEYAITDSNVEPTIWNKLSTVTNKIKKQSDTSYQKGTYYIWLKDKVGNINSTTVNVKSVAIIPISDTSCKKDVIYNGVNQIITNTGTVGYEYKNNSQKNVGSYEVKVLLLNDYVWADNTTNDKQINCSIAKRNITITGASQSRAYNGSSLTNNSSRLTTGTLATNQTGTYTASGTITNVGTTNNVPSVVIKDTGNNDVTSNYNVTKANGKLTITKALTATTGSCRSIIYDGASHTLASGGSHVSYSANNTQTVPGTTAYAITVKSDSNYAFSDAMTSKTLNCNITKRPITITAKAQTINYGSSIATDVGQVTYTATATGVGLLSDHSLDAITLTPSRTSVGTGTITPSAATIEDATITGYYNITYTTGSLTIKPLISMIYLNGAINDTITIKDSNGNIIKSSITTNNDGKATISNIPEGTYTFISSVAKSTTDINTNYSQKFKITTNNQTLNFYPSGAVFWYGNGDGNYVIYEDNSNVPLYACSGTGHNDNESLCSVSGGFKITANGGKYFCSIDNIGLTSYCYWETPTYNQQSLLVGMNAVYHGYLIGLSSKNEINMSGYAKVKAYGVATGNCTTKKGTILTKNIAFLSAQIYEYNTTTSFTSIVKNYNTYGGNDCLTLFNIYAIWRE